MFKKMNKRGTELLIEIVIFYVLIAIFFAAMFYFVNRSSTQTNVIEQIYAKQIALAINKAKPGTVIILGIEEVFEIAEKNKYKSYPVNIDNSGKRVIVTVVEGKGFSYDYFNSANVKWKFKDKKLEMEIEK
jgi:lipoprotein-anchoring transpeptidase ErfK/SrfK